nr:MAG TPA: protein of unknown function (UPF0715) [Bacteriophage sp.]
MLHLILLKLNLLIFYLALLLSFITLIISLLINLLLLDSLLSNFYWIWDSVLILI